MAINRKRNEARALEQVLKARIHEQREVAQARKHAESVLNSRNMTRNTLEAEVQSVNQRIHQIHKEQILSSIIGRGDLAPRLATYRAALKQQLVELESKLSESSTEITRAQARVNLLEKAFHGARTEARAVEQVIEERRIRALRNKNAAEELLTEEHVSWLKRSSNLITKRDPGKKEG